MSAGRDAAARLRGARSHEARTVARIRDDLQRRRWLRWHAFFLGALCIAIGWAISAILLALGVESLALRWTLALGLTYIAYIGLLGVWCHWLVSRDEDAHVPDPGVAPGGGPGPSQDCVEARPFETGGGGDFAGGGAGGSFDAPVGDGVGELAGESLATAGGHALEALGAADEGIVVLVPLAIVVALAAGFAAAFSFAVFGLFGIDVLLGVAVEIVLASAGGALAYKAGREGWLEHALKRTAWPFAAILMATLLCGLLIDIALPEARSLPHAIALIAHPRGP